MCRLWQVLFFSASCFLPTNDDELTPLPVHEASEALATPLLANVSEVFFLVLLIEFDSLLQCCKSCALRRRRFLQRCCQIQSLGGLRVLQRLFLHLSNCTKANLSVCDGMTFLISPHVHYLMSCPFFLISVNCWLQSSRDRKVPSNLRRPRRGEEG